MGTGYQKENNLRLASYDPALDFIRFIAFFLVFSRHFILQGGNGGLKTGQWWDNDFIQRISDFGGQGVTLFFGLTGFLLGRLLIREFNQYGTISIRSFYYRRILRIWPLYFVFVLLCGILNYFADSPTLTINEIPFLLTFTYNWGQLVTDLKGSMASITWSISIEEQIYLFFPIFFLVMARKGSSKYEILLISIGLISVLGCTYFWNSDVSRFTPSYLLPVGIGLLTAKFERYFKVSRFVIINFIFTSLALATYIYFFRNIESSGTFDFFVFILSSLLFPGLLYLTKMFSFESNALLIKILIYIGRRSYGCYLFHWVIWTIMVGRDIFTSSESGFSIIGVLVGFISTVLVSAISYKFFENPILKYRKRYQRVISP
jgi:peptidoglycan/LPS O-acetylase OafA/YrhL